MNRDAASAVIAGAFESTTLSSDEAAFFSSEATAGVTLFRRNIPQDQTCYSATVAMLNKLQALRPAGDPPLLIAIDQEGGRVARMPRAFFPDLGPAQRIGQGQADPSALAVLEAYGMEVGNALRKAAINVNFAPVLDILTEPTNTAIGDRVFGTDPESVCRRAGAYLEGLQSTGVLGCLKHFPGQGDAKVDTHLGSAVIDLPRGLLDKREFIPFRGMVHRVQMVMISHCIYPQLSRKEASRSPEIIGELLRQEMGFEGVVVSDDMTMGAIPQDEKAWQQALIESILAGADLLLICRHVERCRMAISALRSEAARSPAFKVALEAAAGRVLAMRTRLTIP
ncbi:MAG: hypothetical protein RIQ81_567 [Pseudomonadota bacterium]